MGGVFHEIVQVRCGDQMRLWFITIGQKNTTQLILHVVKGEIHITRFDHRITGPCIVLRERDYREYGSQALWLDQSGQIARHEQAMPASINRPWSNKRR